MEATIQKHVKTARPVASRDLLEELRFEVSPATIRNEMLKLDELGYLEQPHTSAGRVPTDRGYRFFVDNLTDVFSLTAKEQKFVNDIFRKKTESEFICELVKNISRLSGMFTASMLSGDNLFYKSGFSEILAEPEFQEPKEASGFGQFTDSLEEEIEKLFQAAGNIGESTEETIFIGEENPLEGARSYSMFFSSWRHPAGFNGFLTLIGPKRTNYLRHKSLLNHIHNL